MNTNYNDTTTANNNNQPMSRSRHNLTKHRVFYLIKCLSYSTLFSITTATNNNSTIGLQQQQFILAHKSSILHLTKTIETQLDKYCFSFFSFSALLQRVQIFISPLFLLFLSLLPFIVFACSMSTQPMTQFSCMFLYYTSASIHLLTNFFPL